MPSFREILVQEDSAAPTVLERGALEGGCARHRGSQDVHPCSSEVNSGTPQTSQGSATCGIVQLLRRRVRLKEKADYETQGPPKHSVSLIIHYRRCWAQLCFVAAHLCFGKYWCVGISEEKVKPPFLLCFLLALL